MERAAFVLTNTLKAIKVWCVLTWQTDHFTCCML